ncbi:MAG: exosome complex protein Rrp42 [Thaumarchaeota archaeon]|nr:exosome complex protein Rrp42 [Nitrososphaerota archaeon]MCY3976218.1 exosome complex protein Rrp42 [Nitrososphaerota archaeon]
MTILDELKKHKILELLKNEKRIDGRNFLEPRSILIETDLIQKANGSARVDLGYTSVIAGVKIQPDKPFPDLGDKGIFICTAEILPLAHPDIEPGPPGEDVIELARVVDRGIRETNMIDLSKLVLEKDKSVIGIFVDNCITDYDGNLFDACSYAATAAILSSDLPVWELKNDQPVLLDKRSIIPISTIPVSVTVGLIDSYLIVDPNADEWKCMDARITITSNSEGNVCALQKGGYGSFTYDQLLECSKIAISVGSKIRKILKQHKKSK